MIAIGTMNVSSMLISTFITVTESKKPSIQATE